MKLLIIRHGDPDYEKDSLTEKGWREAELLSQRLVQMPIRDYFVSPLGRAQATLQPTLKKLNRTAETLPWLEEFRGRFLDPVRGDSVISWDVQPDYRTNCPQLYHHDDWRRDPLYQTGNAAEIYDETAAGVDTLLARYGYQRDISRYGALYRCQPGGSDDIVALVCHFAVGSAILSHLLDVAPTILWHGFCLPASSVTTLVTEERVAGVVQFRCFQMGDTSHLYAGGEPVSQSAMFQERFGTGRRY